MNGPRTRTEPVSALLLQESVLDERIWAPLSQALQGIVHTIGATPPVSPAMLSDEHWAVHAADWIIDAQKVRSAGAIVCHGHAAVAGLEIAARGFTGGPVIVIDPAVAALVPALGASIREKMYEELEREESQDKLARMFGSMPPEALAVFRRTGRLSPQDTERFIDSFLTADDFVDATLFSLVKAMVTERLSRAFAEGVQVRQTPLRTDYPRIAARLGTRLHLVLSARTTIDRLGLRPQLRVMHPDAAVHDLPGTGGVQGWWTHTHDYARLLRSIIRGSAS
jgi:hypothetical protein